MKKNKGRPPKQYIVTDPKGKLVLITNLYQFCLEQGINQANVLRMIKGRCKTAYGYTSGDYTGDLHII